MRCSPNFLSNIKNKAVPVAVDLSSDSSTMVVSFSGFAGNIGIQGFEFLRILSPYNVKKVFLRDVDKSLYHNGLPGITVGIDGTVHYLKKIISHEKVKKSIVFGNCGGAYAAILFGYLLDADEVHAFNPVTFLNLIKRAIARDQIHWREVIRLYLNKNSKKEYFDLSKILSVDNGITTFNIYFSEARSQNRLHCKRMEGMLNVNLKGYDYNRKNLVKFLRDTGELQKIIADILRY